MNNLTSKSNCGIIVVVVIVIILISCFCKKTSNNCEDDFQQNMF